MNNPTIKRLYTKDRWTLRMIAEKYGTNHHLIRRRLVGMGVKITRRNTLKQFSSDHRKKISETRKSLYASGAITPWSKGKKMSRECVLKNMKAHLKYDVTLEWLDSFADIERLKHLNRSLARERDYRGFTTETYKQFIERFYNDHRFVYLFSEWEKTGNKWIKPSLDHIHAKCNGGKLGIDNLQFVSWLENRSKVNIPQEQWSRIKSNISYYL